MRWLPGKQDRWARLCQVMYLGENIARDCAQRQAILAVYPGQQRFLRRQARQESMHARLFRAITARLDPRGNHARTPAARALSGYGQQLHRDIDRHDLAASILGLQGTLEAIGEQVLRASDHSVTGQGERYRRLHQLVVHQETTHHAFGQHWLQRHQHDQSASLSISAARWRYQALAQDLRLACADLLEDIGVDTDSWFAPLPASDERNTAT